MNNKKADTINMDINKISYYSGYVDTFSRIIREFIENGYDNLKGHDIANIVVLLEKYAHRLHTCIMKTKTDWEFL